MKTTFTNFLSFVLTLLFFSLIGSSCNTKKILQPGEKLVEDNIITLNIPKKQINTRNLRYELSTLAKPVPNTNTFYFRPRELIYYNNSQPEDTTKYKRYLKRKVGEKPAIFDPELAEQSAQDMKYYLGNKGFFDADVRYRVKRKGSHKVKVEYIVTTQNIYTIDSVIYLSQDQKINDILSANRAESKLVKDEPVSLNAYNEEVKRIATDLRNQGYFDFDRNFIDTLRADSVNNQVDIYLEIFPPAGRSEHLVYHVGDINVYPDYYPGDEQANLPDTIFEGIHFRSSGRELKIKPQTIHRSIFLRTGELFQEENLEKTNLQLNRLNNFRAISVIPVKDSLREGIVHFDIYLNSKKKLEFELDWELNNSNYTQTGDRISLLGTSMGANFRNWNLFRNATELNHQLKLGIELNLQEITNPDEFIYSADATYNFDLYWPKFVPWLGPYKLLNRIKIGKDDKNGEPKRLIGNFYKQLKENAKTHWSINVSFRNISTLYLENSHNTRFGYELVPDVHHRFRINHTGFTLYFLSNETPLFDTIITRNPFLGLSTDNQLFTGLFFRDFSYAYSGKINPRGESWFFNSLLELSGHEVWAANKIYNSLSNTNEAFTILNGFEFAQYAKAELDLRYYRKLKDNYSLAFRANVGIARPFGFSEQVPYVQQFYLGGGNSMRAWKIRELGPGAYFDPTNTIGNNIAFFQTGDLKIELNGEYRFKLFADFDGAVFLDIGNIWSLDPTDARGPMSQFNFISGVGQNGIKTDGFVNQMAIGTGFGIRWDFSYFILRFDMGLKLRNPNPNFTDEYWFPNWDKLQLRDINPNLAIGYPF